MNSNIANTKLRVGIVGAGFGQNVHLPAFRLLANCDVVALQASSSEKTKMLAQKYELPEVYGSWQEMLRNAHLDILSIATLPDLQIEILQAALQKKGLRIFAEKPLGTRLAQILKLDTIFTDINPKFFIDFEFLQLPTWRRAYQMMRDRKIGNPQKIDVVWKMMTYANRHHLDSWKTSTTKGGGALSAFGSHVFYYLEVFMGPIAELNAVLSRDPQDSRETDTRVEIQCRFANGAEGSVQIDTSFSQSTQHSIEILGDDGCLQLLNCTQDYMMGFGLKSAPRGQDYKVLDDGANLPNDFKDGRIFAVHSLLDQWFETDLSEGGKGPPPPGWREACRVQLLIESALQSHQAQTWLAVSGDFL